MINSGTVDIHIDPYTYTNDIRVNRWLSYDVPFASRYVTKPEVSNIGIPVRPTHVHYTVLPRYRFCSLFLFSCSGIPVINARRVWPDDDGCRHTERVLRISLHRRRSKSQS